MTLKIVHNISYTHTITPENISINDRETPYHKEDHSLVLRKHSG